MTRHDTVLLACGSNNNRKRLRSILSENFNILEAGNTQQTVLLLEQNIDCIAAVVMIVTDPELIDQTLLQSPKVYGLIHQVPVIVITKDDQPGTLSQAFGFGAADVIPENYNSYAMFHRIENIIELHLHKLQLQALVDEQANILQQSNDHMVDALSAIIEYRSVESGQHVLHIRHFTKLLLEELQRCCPEYQLTEEQIRIISSAAALHDVGKISIPDAILTKSGALTKEEWEIMKSHTEIGCRILASLGKVADKEYLHYAYNICRYHHERWDGKGYPEGLSGDEIPICAQVVGIADAYDALTTKRVYKGAFSIERAVNMILNGECGVFSPKLLECFKHIVYQYEELSQTYTDDDAPKNEEVSTKLPSVSTSETDDAVARTLAKYHALVHYANVFLMELDLDCKLFHLIYNPFPEMVSFENITSMDDLKQLVLDKLVVPQEQEKMRKALNEEMRSFLQEGLRRVNYVFHFRSRLKPEGEPFEVTYLRTNPLENTRNTLAILCRKMERAAVDSQPPARIAADMTLFGMKENAFLCRLDNDFTFIRLDNELTGLAGYSTRDVKEILGNRLIEIVHPQDRDMVRQQFRTQLTNSTIVQVEHRVIHKSGKVLWVRNKSRVLTNEAGQEYMHCYLMDISSIKAQEDQLQQKLARYEIILAQTENVLFEWDLATDRVAFSETYAKIFGIMHAEENFRVSLAQGSYFHPEDVPLLVERLGNLEKGSNYEVAEVRIATALGRYLWCRIRASALLDEQGKLEKIVGIIINVDDEKQAEIALQERAESDSLTKLLNKNAGRRHAEEYFQQFAGNLNCALLIIDMDDFKGINDTYGHMFGDTVLTTAAKEIRELFRNQDIISRIGGDEFMVLMRGVSDRTIVENRCKLLVEAFRRMFQNHQIVVGCSVGVALAPEHGDSYPELFKHADEALYVAKQRGKHTFAFYEPVGVKNQSMELPLTRVNQRIDSDENPHTLENNIVQYAFHELYTSHDVDAAVKNILEIVGQKMNVSRVYIFENSEDNRRCSNTFEWCNQGIEPQIQNLQNLSYETDIPDFEKSFNDDGIFYCPDINEQPKHLYNILASQGIKSMLHCAIREKGVFRGYVGFDECVTQRIWTKEQITMLTRFSEMLSVFLLKKRAQDRIAQRLADMCSLMDNQNALIHILDPDTCELKYINAKTKAMIPDAAVGMKCHKVFFDRDCRCEDCIVQQIGHLKNAKCEMQIPKYGITVTSEATLANWEGEEVCLVVNREIENP